MLTSSDAGAQRTAPQERTATSSVSIRSDAGSALVFTVRNTRFDPFVAYGLPRNPTRLLTIVTNKTTRTDAEGSTGHVAVVVEDLSGAAPRRVAAFDDAGTEGVRLGANYFVTVAHGCCDAPDERRVRSLATGRLLFVSTGTGAAGTAAWFEAPNTRPALRRWVAFNALATQAERERGVLGTLSYGSDDGRLSRVALRLAGATSETYEESWHTLAHESQLVWIETDKPAQTGAAAYPASLFSIDGIDRPERIGGFSVRLLDVENHVVTTLPIVADRLVADRATSGQALEVTALPP